MLKKNYLLLFLFLLLASSAFSQISKVHYIPPITSNSGSIADQYIYLSTPSETDVDFDNLVTGNLNNISHLIKESNFDFKKIDITENFKINEKIDFILHFASPASPIDYLKIPITL